MRSTRERLITVHARALFIVHYLNLLYKLSISEERGEDKKNHCFQIKTASFIEKSLFPVKETQIQLDRNLIFFFSKAKPRKFDFYRIGIPLTA
jgi:hypothetical protein